MSRNPACVLGACLLAGILVTGGSAGAQTSAADRAAIDRANAPVVDKVRNVLIPCFPAQRLLKQNPALFTRDETPDFLYCR